jgi:hypothetical protein
MKTNQIPADNQLKTGQTQSSDQSTDQKDKSIRADKDPLPARGAPKQKKEDSQNKIQDEFIDRDNNSKEEG